jgi:hypothetical protein
MLFQSFLTIILLPILLLIQPSHGAPTPTILRRLFGSSLDILDSVILFDAPAFQDGSGGLTAVMPAFVSIRQIDLGPVTSALTALLNDVGVSVGDKASTFADRAQLFSAIGLGGKEVDVDVVGCSDGQVSLAQTSGSPDLGQMLKTVSLGNCGSGLQPLVGNVQVSALDNRQFNATIFPSPPDGFGVISDIDDTVKITDVLDVAKTFEATFLDDPVPVPGMPDVYNSLKSTLSNPQFFYVSGSPSQLYPFLHSFIGSTYPAGPILLQNVTLTDFSQLRNLASPDGIEVYKSAMIDRIQQIYPGKTFLTVGDSTQKDPETYGAAFRKFGPNFISCIWIRQFAGANNTAERFAAAFEGVPAAKIRLYNDSDIPSLSTINVAGGNC